MLIKIDQLSYFIRYMIILIIPMIYACDSEIPDGLPGHEETVQSHNEEWANPEKHGFSFFYNMTECKPCHGQDLMGGTSGISCNNCHSSNPLVWHEDCTFCHGGLYSQTGAPPYGIHNEPTKGVPHTKHVEESVFHEAIECSVCHITPTKFDDPHHIEGTSTSHVTAEILFQPIAGPYASYDFATATCMNIYCHGNGQKDNGAALSWAASLSITCDSCHNTTGDASLMSGKHKNHLFMNYSCETCHKEVVDLYKSFKQKALHVNGQADISLFNDGSYDESTKSCTVTCHNNNPKVWTK